MKIKFVMNFWAPKNGWGVMSDQKVFVANFSLLNARFGQRSKSIHCSFFKLSQNVRIHRTFPEIQYVLFTMGLYLSLFWWMMIFCVHTRCERYLPDTIYDVYTVYCNHIHLSHLHFELLTCCNTIYCVSHDFTIVQLHSI